MTFDSLCELDCSSPEKRTICRNRISAFISNLKNRWNKCQRKLDRFLNKNQFWLDSDFDIPKNTSTPPNQIKGTWYLFACLPISYLPPFLFPYIFTLNRSSRERF